MKVIQHVMTKIGRPRRLKNFVARLALRQLPTLSAEERIDALEGAALILPKKEAEAARYTAAQIRNAERHQAHFQQIMEKTTNDGGTR